ncbi:DUF2853 family protein [Rhodobacter sp. NSM]|uniref:DUF2853 family protein n=1 Tax=Rhodobacter sp. NSM TaxID=3457501 RepID=UPI003FD498E2
MSRRDELIAKYAAVLRDRCGLEPDMDLLKRVTIACGPSIYDADAETVAASSATELATVRKNFLMGKLGLPDGPELDEALTAVIERYGKSDRNKYRVVLYYLLTVHFHREAVLA